jgi:hypothetical protein
MERAGRDLPPGPPLPEAGAARARTGAAGSLPATAPDARATRAPERDDPAVPVRDRTAAGLCVSLPDQTTAGRARASGRLLRGATA